MNSDPAMEENDVTHEKTLDFEPLLEASGEQTPEYQRDTYGMPMPLPGTDSVVSGAFEPLLDIGRKEIRSVGLPDYQQKVTLFVVSTMLALRWIEEHVTKYRESRAPTAESIHAIDYNWRLELFETACKVFSILFEVRHVWSRIRFFPWFRATLTSWLYTVTKVRMKKHQSIDSSWPR